MDNSIDQSAKINELRDMAKFFPVFFHICGKITTFAEKIIFYNEYESNIIECKITKQYLTNYADYWKQ
ncbi:MAG: hypothetical protein IKW78_02280, partial [Prevotella sp.]|nr:hypothetical protein [Prevotella sp.]